MRGEVAMKSLNSKILSAPWRWFSSRRNQYVVAETSDITWLHPWRPIDPIPGLADEIHLEMAPGHQLFAMPVRAIARRGDNDDVLFLIEGGSGRVAEVHLTWRRETNPDWPSSGIFASLDRWAATAMIDDHLFVMEVSRKVAD